MTSIPLKKRARETEGLRPFVFAKWVYTKEK